MSKTLKLKHPVEFGGEEIAELVFPDEMRAKHWKGLPIRSPMHYEDVLKIAGRLTGQPDLVIDELHSEDMQAVTEIVASFF